MRKNNKVTSHLFLGGNYGIGSTTICGIGMFKFGLLKKAQKIGSKVLKGNSTDKSDILYFTDPRTVQIFINHFTKMKKEMLKSKPKKK